MGRRFGRIYPYGGFDPRIGGYRPIPRDGKPVPLPPQDGWDPIAGGYRPKRSVAHPIPPDGADEIVLKPETEEEPSEHVDEE
jgi:hypothetical protein